MEATVLDAVGTRDTGSRRGVKNRLPQTAGVSSFLGDADDQEWELILSDELTTKDELG